MGLIKFILSTDSRISLRRIRAQAEKIIDLSPKYESMTDECLKSQTDILKDRLAKGETL